MNILITGGAGFIGRHLCAALALQGHQLTVLDSFLPQVHVAESELQFRHSFKGRVIRGDVRDKDVLQDALQHQHAVIHLAAETGTGQSMYEVKRYESVNIGGTALMLDCLVNDPKRSVSKIIVASSRATYGEGRYRCAEHGVVYPSAREELDMRSGLFEPRCPDCRQFVTCEPTTESAPFSPSSFYGLTKQVQEQMVLMYARVLGISGYALRYQNVYGPGQSLNNPYTGILAVFSNLAREHRNINIFEDGNESRDFVYIDDVVEATTACLDRSRFGTHAVNVGSGVAIKVSQIARTIVEQLGSRSNLQISGTFRQGDIRHNIADLTLAQNLLSYSPKVRFEDGLTNFLKWAQLSDIALNGYENSLQELRTRGLMHG